MYDTTHSNPITTLHISPADLGTVIGHLRAALPNEGVLLLGTSAVGDEPGTQQVRHVFPGTNVRSSPIRFAMDELEIVRALREIDERGWILGAIVHSHPNGPATPSRTDLAEAFYPESLMVIVSFATEKPDLRGWRLERRDDAWEPVEVPVVSGGGVAKCAANCAPFSGS